MYSIGIITFHCADNYGAMLQAYALKQYLRKQEISADIVRYEPPFMTGRHWWIPYIPSGGLYEILKNGWNGWKRNLEVGRKFLEKRIKMKQFRKQYLVESRQRKLLFVNQLKRLKYQYYIVGSDQIWNPDITWGLRRAYFGAFRNKYKRRVIAYAASLGKAGLSSVYDKQFSELLSYVDDISVRECAALSYINKFCKKKIAVVLDPVFLLKSEEWQKIEKLPNEKGYIFAYMTEDNQDLVVYLKNLSKSKNLCIITNSGRKELKGDNIVIDYTMDPAQFLGYIHNAKYVVTNSFHGTAFSIIFKKNFMAFNHSSVGERIINILTLHDLEKRLYKKDTTVEIDCNIDWIKVERNTEINIRCAELFLLEHIKYETIYLH